MIAFRYVALVSEESFAALPLGHFASRRLGLMQLTMVGGRIHGLNVVNWVRWLMEIRS
jgi:hypothetical protein